MAKKAKLPTFHITLHELLAGGLIVGVVVVYVLGRIYFPDEYVQNLITSLGQWGPLLYIVLSLLIYILLPTLAPPIVYIGYDLFGKHVVWYISIAAFLNFFTNFWIARIFGRELIIKMIGKRAAKKIDKLSSEYGLVTLFFLRVFQGGIHDLISYSAGLTNLPFFKYLVVSVAGLIPGMLLWYAIALAYPNTVHFFFASTVISMTLTGIFLVGSIFINVLKSPASKK